MSPWVGRNRDEESQSQKATFDQGLQTLDMPAMPVA
jgi:hypothetical protein